MGLVLENVRKSYSGKNVVDNISFNMDKPGVFGLLGTNGAGKTTTIRMILGIIKKDSGSITWNGKSVERKNVNFGYLPEERGIYPKIKIYDQLMYFAELKGMKRQEADDEIKKWAEKLEVSEYLNMQAEKLSKGNQQKIQFMTAILHNPDLIILDEPFSGLDPINSGLLKDVIIELINRGKYIIMSSHQMMSIEEFCKDVVILNKGKTVLSGNLNEIKSKYPANRINLITNKNVDDIIKKCNIEIYINKENQYELKINSEADGNKLFKELSKTDVEVTKFEIMKPSLNDIFIEKVGK